MSANDSLGDRMKTYESAFRSSLPRRLPVILRVDGKAFHTLTRGFDRPFDSRIEEAMSFVAQSLCDEIDGAVLAYRQSDEVSVLIRNDQTTQTEPWFGNNIQKLTSVSASVATWACSTVLGAKALFDSRVFVLPSNEVVNYFVWRQQDASRNSVQMLARSLFSHNECHNKNNSELQEMCFQAGTNWNDLPTHRKRGSCVRKVIVQKPIEAGPRKGEICDRRVWQEDVDIPIFTQDRSYVERLLNEDHERAAL